MSNHDTLPVVPVVPDAPLAQLSQEVHAIAVSKGWWDTERNFGEMLLLWVTEIAEAFEAWRDPNAGRDLYVDEVTGKPEGIVAEVADVIIRILDTAAAQQWDLDAAVRLKIEYNRTRPYRHGGKRA